MDAAAFAKLGQPAWLPRPPGVVSICILVASWRCRQERVSVFQVEKPGCYHCGGSVRSQNLGEKFWDPWSVDLQLGLQTSKSSFGA